MPTFIGASFPWSEIDDGLTLLYLLGRPEIRLVAVTTTFGNGPEDVVFACTRRLPASVIPSNTWRTRPRARRACARLLTWCAAAPISGE